MKKPFYEKWWIWVLTILLIGSVMSAVSGCSSSDSSSSSKSSKTEKTYKIGDTVQVGKMTYVVSKKDVADQVGPSILPTKATGKFIVIEVSVKNGDTKAVTVDSNFFKLLHAGKTYEANTTASMSANQGENGTIQNSFFLQQVNPDSEVKGFVVFDVAPDIATATDLQLQVQTGAFGTETAKINLQ